MDESRELPKYRITCNESYLIYLIKILVFILVRCIKNTSEFKISHNCKHLKPYNIAIHWIKNKEEKNRLIRCQHMHKNKPITNVLELSKCLEGYTKIKDTSTEYHDLIKCTTYENPKKDCNCENDELLNTTLHAPFKDENIRCIGINVNENQTVRYLETTINNLKQQQKKSDCKESVFQEYKDKIKYWILNHDEADILSETEDTFDKDFAENFIHELKRMIERTLTLNKTEGISHVQVKELQNRMLRNKYRKEIFNMKDPVRRFHGRRKEMGELNKFDQIVVIHGPEGVGKTELAKKFASELKYNFSIWINAQTQESIKKCLDDVAFNKLNIEKNYEGCTNDIKTILSKICHILEPNSGKILFIFDDAKENIDLISSLENHFVLITTRENNIHLNAQKVELTGFSESEAIEYAKDSLGNEIEINIPELVKQCNYNPGKIEEAISLHKIQKFRKFIFGHG